MVLCTPQYNSGTGRSRMAEMIRLSSLLYQRETYAVGLLAGRQGTGSGPSYLQTTGGRWSGFYWAQKPALRCLRRMEKTSAVKNEGDKSPTGDILYGNQRACFALLASGMMRLLNRKLQSAGDTIPRLPVICTIDRNDEFVLMKTGLMSSAPNRFHSAWQLR